RIFPSASGEGGGGGAGIGGRPHPLPTSPFKGEVLHKVYGQAGTLEPNRQASVSTDQLTAGQGPVPLCRRLVPLCRRLVPLRRRLVPLRRRPEPWRPSQELRSQRLARRNRQAQAGRSR